MSHRGFITNFWITGNGERAKLNDTSRTQTDKSRIWDILWDD